MATEAGKEGKAVANLRYERDRFVAFAFASADAFLEINVDLKILYATGAVQRLLDRAPRRTSGPASVGFDCSSVGASGQGRPGHRPAARSFRAR